MSETSDEAVAQIDPHEALRNILQHLQQEPQRYRLFGVWWWPIKALLKAAGYGPAQLYMLGSYSDPEVARLVPHTGLQDTLRQALAEYGWNAAYPRPGGVAEDPDGELVRIYDEDAGI